MSKKRVIERRELLEELDKRIGYCPNRERTHSYLDFVDADGDEKACQFCSQTVFIGVWYEARSLEMVLVDGAWHQNADFVEGYQ